MKFLLDVENIKCGGCASHIEGKLNAINGVKSINIDVELGQISGEMLSDVLNEVKTVLAKLGYPETGTQEGLEAMGSKAKSFVSCAIGKMNK